MTEIPDGPWRAVELPSPRMTLIDHGVEHGIPWVTCRAPLYGAANGYVKIPAGHHWHGLDYDAINVDVHGGLTYADGDWIGFDTAHCGDIWPGTPDYGGPKSWDRYWDDEQVATETRSLARKVSAAAFEVAELSGSRASIGDEDELLGGAQ
ncbi:hypothetical protein [Mycobacterium ostraviense]|uniref:hypothetical protein n=1 Tax=Mycobacterium ostraviense TaxID=2738409 RepID=UPI00094C6F2F|nr:hypothetical protein [Mycobacterium ostraviense]